MRDKDSVIRSIFNKHGEQAIYITNTGYLSRDIYDIYPDNENIFYMQGSMGLSPAIALGMSFGETDRDIVCFVGDASLLMHLGITHTIRDSGHQNIHVYVIDNGMHESVGMYHCSPLEKEYPGVTEIFKVKRGQKRPRVGIGFKENATAIRSTLSE